MSRQLPFPLQRLARDQQSVVTREQLREHGIDADLVRRRVLARSWQVVGGRVVVLHSGPLSPAAREWAGVLHAGPRAALAGRTAAAAAGLRGWQDPDVHVVVPRSAPRVAPVPGLVVHVSRRFEEADVLEVGAPRRVRPSRALVDAAAWSRKPRTAVGVLAAGVQQRLSTPERLLVERRAAGRIRHARLLDTSLHDMAGGSHALSEIDLVRLCRRGGLPAPVRQAVRRTPDGRVRYLDAEFEGPGGRRLVVEVDGFLHMVVQTWLDDMDRQNELVIADDLVLRFPSIRLRLEPDRCLDQLRRALAMPRAA